MALGRVGKYRLSRHLLSGPNGDEHRAADVDADGSFVRHVFLCGLQTVADTPQQRTKFIEKLCECDYVPLPNCLPLIDVFDDSASSGFDVVVVSRWDGGCSLTCLLDAGVAPGLKLTLYVVRVLCTSLLESYRRVKGRGHASVVGLVSPDRVWIDRDATIRMHNPFVWPDISGPALEERTAEGDVAALQHILKKLTDAWSSGRNGHDKGTEVPADIGTLLVASREPTESTTDFLERFSAAVEEVADSRGAVEAAAIAELGSFAWVFEREAALLAREIVPTVTGATEKAPTRWSEVGASPETADDALALFKSEADLRQEASVTAAAPPGIEAPRETDRDSLESFRSEAEVEETPVVAAAPPNADTSRETAQDRPAWFRHLMPAPPAGSDRKAQPWPRLVIAATVILGLIGAGTLFFGQRPGIVPFGTTQRGTLDLADLQVSPSNASLYLVLAEGDRPYDGRLVSLEPGVHEIEIRAEGHKTTRVTVQVAPGETATLASNVVLPVDPGMTDDPQIGHLRFAQLRLTPPSGRVLVNGEEVSTDAQLGLQPGLHRLSFASYGFLTEERDVTVEPGRTVSFDEAISLRPIPRQGTVVVRSDVPVDVFENETQLGSTPFTGRFNAGLHTMEFRYQNLSTRLAYQVQPDQTVLADLEVVRVNSEPFSEVAVRLDGSPPVVVGTTPGRVLAPAGATLVFTHPRFGPREVFLEPGRTAVSMSFADP